ncbi:MAG: 4-hydroxy-tetrahydrodipicolinate synthase [Candidatus Bathyarchaeia archaeon]|jgi:4-hydroxy-tetrahydrodipicolinate synthase
MPRLVLDGIFVPHVTPFKRGGQLDINALRECVRFWMKSGVSGLVPCGSNGEAPYLSRQERKKVIETVLDEVNGKVPVVAGTGSMSTQETVAFTKDAAELGVDAALIVTPFYFRLTSREIYEHYRTVCQAVDLPIVVYNVPKFTGFSLEPSSIERLASENQSIIGLKESSGSFGTISEVIRLLGNRLSVLAGTADVALPTLQAGGRGAVIAVANVFPTLCSRLYRAYKKGQYEEASRLQNRISFANEVLVKRFNQLSAIKEGMRLEGLPGGYPRKPALPLDEKERKTLEDLLKKIEEPV